MYYLFENAKFALESLKSHKARTFLTLLGIIIGVASIIIIGAVSNTGKRFVLRDLETFGIKSFWIYRSFQYDQPGKASKGGTGINGEDIEAIVAKSRFSTQLSPIIEKSDKWAKYKNKYSKIILMAVDSTYALINNDSIIEGRFMLSDDIKFRKYVCVIGPKVVEKLFGIENAIGKEIRIDNYKCAVVGILKEKDLDFFKSIGLAGVQNINYRVMIPISTYQRQNNIREIDYIQGEVARVSLVNKAAEEVKKILSLRHKGEYNYESQTMQYYIDKAESILRLVTWIGSATAIIALLVGGIGIMNIMIVSVMERGREIGIRKALGATTGNIVMLFLIESVFISLSGGILGILFGISCIYMVDYLTDKTLIVSVEYILLSLFSSATIGILSGIYPAMKAASKDPVDALRL